MNTNSINTISKYLLLFLLILTGASCNDNDDAEDTSIPVLISQNINDGDVVGPSGYVELTFSKAMRHVPPMIRLPQSSSLSAPPSTAAIADSTESTQASKIYSFTYLPPSFSFKPDRSSILLTDLTRSDKSPKTYLYQNNFTPALSSVLTIVSSGNSSVTIPLISSKYAYL